VCNAHLCGRNRQTFAPRSPGQLDIDHIVTEDNATFLLAPDGATLLIDCDASNHPPEVSASSRPDASRGPGERVVRYALRHAHAASRHPPDYNVAAHVHPDHVGDIPSGNFS